MSTGRDKGIDFVKGVAVVGMAVGHTLCYFAPYSLLYRYCRFVTGVFVFLAGYLVTSIYSKKYDFQSGVVGNKLIVRGVKILLIFVLSNVSIKIFLNNNVLFDALTLESLSLSFYKVFVLGDFLKVAFELLIPIGYVLIALGILVNFFPTRFSTVILWASVILFAYCSIAFFEGVSGYNLRFVTIGLCGAAFGAMPSKVLDYFRRHARFVSLIYLIYLAILPLMHTSYYILYMGIVLINFITFYLIGAKIKSSGLFIRKLNLLGAYSLMSYLLQMAFLQVLLRVFPSAWADLTKAALGTIFTIAVNWLAVETTDLLRKKSQSVRLLYGQIFA